VLAYYAQILVDRERPRITRPTWAQRKPAPAPETSGTPTTTWSRRYRATRRLIGEPRVARAPRAGRTRPQKAPVYVGSRLG